MEGASGRMSTEQYRKEGPPEDGLTERLIFGKII